MGNLLAELKRRQMFRVAAAYAVVAWLLLQIFNNVAPILEFPPWVGRVLLLLLVIGFPITLLAIWMQQLAPADSAAPQAATTKLDVALIGALVAVIGIFLYQQLAPPTGTTVADQANPATQTAGLSIAVLPFDNLSTDAEQEFFSVGMSDEIMTALAKVQSLSVVARESAHQYKGERNDMRAVGRALNARYLINGSVRRAGNRVRITAQLVRADDGVGLWTDSFDRELVDIFAIQEDIARAIVGALRVPLGLQQGETLVASRTSNPESYDQYLRAQTMYRNRANDQARALVEALVAREPGFAPGWALLARLYGTGLVGVDLALQSGDVETARRVADEALSRSEPAAQRAIQLDPDLADGYVSMARIRQRQGQILLADELLSKALALDKNNPEALHFYSVLLAGAGRVKEALAMRQQLQTLEPFVPIFNGTTADILRVNGQNEAAAAILERLPANDPARAAGLAQIYAVEGRYSEAADALLTAPSGAYPAGVAEEAARLLRTAPRASTSLPNFAQLGLVFVYVYVGAPERAAEFYEASADAGYLFVSYEVWQPSHAPVRKTASFRAYIRKSGFLDYWRAKGWPDLCRPVGADEFVCD